VVLGDELRRLLEMPWRREYLRQLARQRLVGPKPVSRRNALVAVGAEADLEPAADRPLAAVRTVQIDGAAVGPDRDVAVGDASGERDRLGPEPGEEMRAFSSV